MQVYRFYVLNKSGRMVNRIDADCYDDDVALKLASELIGPAAASEVWDGGRLVGRVVAPDVPPDTL